MAQLELYFSDENEPALEKTVFKHESFDEAIKTLRGSGGSDGYRSFRWTPAVQALALLMVNAAAAERGHDGVASGSLVGEAGSPAASLDYAITKQTAWLLDMFGMDYEGHPLIRRFIKRQNSERKRPGPVTVSVDMGVLPGAAIKVFLGKRLVESEVELQALAHRLETNWKWRSGRPREEEAAAEEELIAIPPPIPQPTTHTSAVEKESNPLHLSMPRIVAGFSLTVASSAFWGLGNVITRWTARRIPRASFDIALLKYLIAAVLLLAVGGRLSRRLDPKFSLRSHLRCFRSRLFQLSALAKALNTYSWILAVTLIAAAPVATLENLHIVWTAIAVALIFRERIPGAWIAGSVTVIIGATLITGLVTNEIGQPSAAGILLGLLSGLAFSLFIVSWNSQTHAATLAERTVEMGLLLLTSGVVMYPVHLVVNAFWLHGSFIPLAEVGLEDGLVQGVNGLFGIGVTYFLLNEATALMKNAGNLATVLLAIGMSFAVPITMVVEWVILGRQITGYQWMGAILFVIGFTTVRAGILRLNQQSS